MAFLDNSGDIILDAVLTDVGRRRMANGNFKISKFALGDDEINYSQYDLDHPSGSSYSDLQILQTPIFEAVTAQNSAINYGLLSITRNDILYMPSIKINNKYFPAYINLMELYERTNQNKKLIENAKKIVDNSHIATQLGDASMFGDEPELSSPEILSTIISILIQKFGTTRLSIDDFAALGVGEFVSVYVDQGTMEIILSMDQNLSGKASFDVDVEDPLSSFFATSPKDDTYH